jgi:hypothetical protein
MRRPKLDRDPTFWRDAVPPWWVMLSLLAVWGAALWLSIAMRP